MKKIRKFKPVRVAFKPSSRTRLFRVSRYSNFTGRLLCDGRPVTSEFVSEPLASDPIRFAESAGQKDDGAS
ncbi:hypothetical protein [Burkholderia multivorans]|uniref:hypothetical protein n=1 Tax=Burkholderia multivorans TaxID=87883 RepID=UPI0011B1E267|nr:hypothetical protein [Burkholderia multivorans]